MEERRGFVGGHKMPQSVNLPSFGVWNSTDVNWEHVILSNGREVQSSILHILMRFPQTIKEGVTILSA